MIMKTLFLPVFLCSTLSSLASAQSCTYSWECGPNWWVNYDEPSFMQYCHAGSCDVMTALAPGRPCVENYQCRFFSCGQEYVGLCDPAPGYDNCGSDSDCGTSEYCDSGTCFAKNSYEGGRCVSDYSCQGDLYCQCPDDTSIKHNMDLCSDFGVCTAQSSTTTPCTNMWDCPNWWRNGTGFYDYCDTSVGFCTSGSYTKSAGALCSEHWECDSFNCQLDSDTGSKMCFNQFDVSCTDDSDCAGTGTCNGGYCDWCSTDSDCGPAGTCLPSGECGTLGSFCAASTSNLDMTCYAGDYCDTCNNNEGIWCISNPDPYEWGQCQEEPNTTPTQSPTATPTQSPTTAPTLPYPCFDSPLQAKLETAYDDEIPFACKWLKMGQAGYSCSETGDLASHCPKACGTCKEYKCKDSEARFILQKKERTCDYIRSLGKKKRSKMCKKAAVKRTCRETCGLCD